MRTIKRPLATDQGWVIRLKWVLGVLFFAVTRILPSVGSLLLLLVAAHYLGTDLGGDVAAWLIGVTFMAILGRFGGDRMVQRLHAEKKRVPITYLIFILGFSCFTSLFYSIYCFSTGRGELLITFFVVVLCSILYIAQAIVRSAGYKYFSSFFDPGVSFLFAALIILAWAEMVGYVLNPYATTFFILTYFVIIFFFIYRTWVGRLSFSGWPKGAVSVFLSTLSGQGAKSGFWFLVSFIANGAFLYNINVSYKYAQLGNFLLSIANQRWYTRYTKDQKGLRFAVRIGFYLGFFSFIGYLALFTFLSYFDLGINDKFSLLVFSASVMMNNLFGPMGFYLSMIGHEKVNLFANFISILLALFLIFGLNVAPDKIPFVYMVMVVSSNIFQAVMARRYIRNA